MAWPRNKQAKSQRRGCMLTTIPHPGYYQGMYAGELEDQSQQESEHRAESDRETQPEGLRLDAEAYAELLFDAADWRKMEGALNLEYVEALNYFMTQMIGQESKLVYESMSSPKEYNFTTDRIFCDIPTKTVRRMLAISKEDGHATLAKVIEERHSSYDGFASYYSSNSDEWLARKVTDWDHNELHTLILAIILLRWKHTDESDSGHCFKWGMYYRVTNDESGYNAFSEGIDWAKFDAACADKREEMRLEAIGGCTRSG